jgi:hypothetical protein
LVSLLLVTEKILSIHNEHHCNIECDYLNGLGLFDAFDKLRRK